MPRIVWFRQIVVEASDNDGVQLSRARGEMRSLKAGLKTRLYFVLTGRGAGVAHGVALKLASFGSRRNDVLV